MANTATTTKMAPSATDVAIEITNMNKWYGDFHVLRDINLRVGLEKVSTISISCKASGEHADVSDGDPRFC
ncbi:ABC-type histidine transport system ATPase subunit [Sinorhizobium meliloti]|nr:ABC-type histidine transport system ATPase subunit [Sinorhizobium meliloti]